MPEPSRKLYPLQTAMELLSWSVRRESDELVAYCCGGQVAATMPKNPKLHEPLELHCNECGARVMPASWAGVKLSEQERQHAVESGRYWLAVFPGPQETTLQLAGHSYRLLAQRDPTEGRWHGKLWRDDVEIFTYTDQILLGTRDVNGLDQVKRMVCIRAHHDAGEQQHDCEDKCWRPAH